MLARGQNPQSFAPLSLCVEKSSALLKSGVLFGLLISQNNAKRFYQDLRVPDERAGFGGGHSVDPCRLKISAGRA
jgi:hypothetical protein